MQRLDKRTLSATRQAQLLADLTCIVKDFQGKNAHEVCFYTEDAESFHVPRFYPGQPRTTPEPALARASSASSLRFKGEMHDTAARPQKTAFQAVLAQLRTLGGALLVAGCGTGKTVIALALAVAFGNKTLIFTHTDDLASQWRERIEQFVETTESQRPRVGLLQQDVCDYEDCPFVIASMMSVRRRAGYVPEAVVCDLLIVDEAHRAAAQSYFQAIGLTRPRATLGLTATPERPDGLGKVVEWLLGPVAFRHEEPPNRTVQANLIRYSRHPPCIPRDFGRNRTEFVVSLLTRDALRNRLLVALLRKLHARFPHRKGLLLTARVAHARRLYAMLDDPSMSAVITGQVHTDMSVKERRSIKRQRRTVSFDKFVTLSTYQMFSEAVDFDGDFVVLAAPKVRVQQSTGRVTRFREGKPRPLIFDLVDCGVGDFEGWHWARRRLYLKRGFELVELLDTDLLPELAA